MQGLADSLGLRLQGHYRNDFSISLCTTTCNRFDHLEQTFIRNILDNRSFGNIEFVLLNYGCPDPRTEQWVKTELTPYIESGLVNYYRYNTDRFRYSHARNLAFCLAKGRILCNVDADNYTGQGFAAFIAAKFSRHANIFLRGPSDGRGLAGRICVSKEHWKAVLGFDERMVNWGSEDRDLSNRLQMLGLKCVILLPEKFCRTIPHSDERRVLGVPGDRRRSISINREIANKNLQEGNLQPNTSSFTRSFRRDLVIHNFSRELEVTDLPSTHSS